MEQFTLDKQSLSFKALYNEIEISKGNQLLHKIKGISIIPAQVKIEPLIIKENLLRKSNQIVQNKLFQNVYYTNIIDYSLGEITFASNFLTENWIEKIWNLITEEKENFLSISLNDGAIKEHLLKANTELFETSDDIDKFCEEYGIKVENFVVSGQFEQIEIELEGISARLSSEIIFFRKKLFTELFIQKMDAKIYEYENVKYITLPQKKKEIYINWRASQLRDIEIIQKYIKSPFTFNDLEQFSNFKTINDFAIKNHDQQDLISETLYWIDSFAKVKKRFEIAVNHYNSKIDFRDCIDNLRLALELLLKELLQNEKSLENQISNISIYQEKLGIGKEIRNTFQKTLEYFNKYQNEHVKHDDSINNIHEVEFIFGLTMIFIRMLIKPNPKFQLK